MAVMDELCTKEGVTVRMVNRSGSTSEPLPPGVELRSGDASDPAFATEAAAGADVIYNALNPPYHKWVTLFPPLQASLITAAEAHAAKLVVMDNLYMYGDTDGHPLHEGLPMTATTKKGALRAEMARDLMAAHEAGRVQAVVGRASDFFGPRVYNSVLGGGFVIERALEGKAAQLVGDVDMPHSYTYMPDIGRALVELAHTPDAYGRAWHLPTPQAVTTRRMLALIYAEAGHPVKISTPPNWLLRVMGLFNPSMGEMVEMLYEFEKPFLIDDSAFRERFGWGATPLEVAIPQTVAWFRR
jgi:nucleoside-diphosphate-sugar epimerase